MATEYRLTAGSVTVGAETYFEGDTVELSDAAAAAFADVLEEADGSDTDAEVSASEAASDSESEDDAEPEDSDTEAETDGEPESEDDTLEYDDLTVTELEDELEERDVSEAELEDLLEYEEENKDRTGAKDAIQSHLS